MTSDDKNNPVDPDLDPADPPGSAETRINSADASGFAETRINSADASGSEETRINSADASGSAKTRINDPAHLPIGGRFGGFVVEAEIARGEMGIVFRVKRVRLNRTEALKVIAPKYSNDPAFHARFEREAMNAAIADHPNVVRVYDAGEIDGLLYIAMQYVDGADLRQMLAAQGKLPAVMATEITRQIGSALDAAHANGLIHRDVKPANILITGTGAAMHAYLSDFGVSRHVAPLSDLTLPGSVVGTPDYSSPEQHLGQPLDHRSDVYSLGCVLYEMLTGSKPYKGGSITAVAIAHTEQPPPLVRDTNPSLPPALDLVVAKAMAKDPDDRYQSAGELGAAAIAASREGPTVETEGSTAETAIPIKPDEEVGQDPIAVKPTEAVSRDPIADVPPPATDDAATQIRVPVPDPTEEKPTRVVRTGGTEDTATRVDVRGTRDEPTRGGHERPRRHGWLVLAIAALVAIAVAIGVVVASHHGGNATSAKVISPVGVNVRSSPAVEGGNHVGHIGPHKSVTVSCSVTGRDAAAGWDKLHSPYPGRYVAADLLKPKSSVPRCS